MFFRRVPLLSKFRNDGSNNGRRSRAAAKRALNDAVRHHTPIEALEKRQLLTTLTGGGGTGANQQTATYEFLDGDDNVIRIAMRGNITAEFIGMWVAASDNEAPLSASQNILTDLITPNQPNPLDPDEDLPGAYIYSIYIASADIDASMSIATVPETGDSRPMQPFSGGVESFSVLNARTGEDFDAQPAGASGGVLFGAVTGDTIDATDDEENIAILSATLKKDFGVRPRTPKGKLDAGISTAPGVSIGQILLGGTIIGRVSIGGSINTFYAGQIWTGDARGIDYRSAPTIPRNFEVGGDLRNLVTIGSIGTDAIDDNNLEEVDFKTGFDLKVRGRLGSIVTKDSFLGAIDVMNDPNFIGPGTAIPEIEVRGTPRTFSQSFFEGDEFSFDPRQADPGLGDNPIFNNDTLDTAQFLGTIRSANFGGRVLAEVHGGLNGNDLVDDDVDYYAMGLLAGQNVEVQLSSRIEGPTAGNFFSVGVFDPDGRMIASDYSNNDPEISNLAPFRFTADRPGIYRFAVANLGDINFNGIVDGDQATGEAVSSIEGPNPYTLRIDRVADIALGGLIATNNIGFTDALDPNSFFVDSFTRVTVQNGDLGALATQADTAGGGGGTGGDSIFSLDSIDITGNVSYFNVARGNLRAIDSDSIGILRANEPVGSPNLRVPRGTVGLLRARGDDNANNVLSVNRLLVSFGGNFDVNDSIGFDYQLVDARAIFAGNLLADRGIGIVRADQFSTFATAPRIAANADNIGNDGFIDLLDARTSMGTLQAGGPQLTTGTGGNVRYIRSQGLIFRDQFFGGGALDETSLRVNTPFRYTDDSGASIKITPLPIIPLGGDPTNAVGMTVQTYGVRDHGGSVLTRVGINTVVTVNGVQQAAGLLIDSGSGAGSGGAEIGEVELIGTGAPVTFATQGTDAAGNPIVVRQFNVDRTASLDQTIEMKGRRPVSVFSILGTNINLIDNRTSGEIVNLTANSLGTMRGQNIGIATSRTNAKLEGVDVLRDVFPYSEQRTLINVAGAIQSIEARGAVGNIFSTSTIGTVTANSDGADQRGFIEGVNAPIVADGSILTVNIGEMLTPSGQGDFQQSGIFANGVIGTVRNQGTNSDIRGDIVAQRNSFLPGNGGTLTTIAGIGEIIVENGSIIESDIYVARWTDSLDLPRARVFPGPLPFDQFPVFIPNMGPITLEGNGGIIGSIIGADSLSDITIKGGFGLIDSRIDQAAAGTWEGIDTDGYGIRLSQIDGGSTIDHIIARGTGKIIDTRSYSITVRQSESLSFDPYTGRQLNRANDLHKFLGTTGASPKNKNTSVAGTIEDSTITGARDLNLISAFRITGRPEVIDPISERQAMRISFAENIGDIIISENINGLDLTAGTVNRIQTGKDILNSTMNISGVLRNLNANNVKASTTIDVQGGEGRIQNITTKRALFGRVTAGTRIDNITVGTDLGSKSVSSSNDIGTVIINGNILSGATLRAADQIASLTVHGNIEEGGTVRAKRITSQTIDGSVSGDIVIG